MHQVISTTDVIEWLSLILAVIVSLLTLYNAARLKTGILAVATYYFGAGMLAITGGLFLLGFVFNTGVADMTVIEGLFLVGFILLGYGSYRIYKMSVVK